MLPSQLPRDLWGCVLVESRVHRVAMSALFGGFTLSGAARRVHPANTSRRQARANHRQPSGSSRRQVEWGRDLVLPWSCMFVLLLHSIPRLQDNSSPCCVREHLCCPPLTVPRRTYLSRALCRPSLYRDTRVTCAMVEGCLFVCVCLRMGRESAWERALHCSDCLCACSTLSRAPCLCFRGPVSRVSLASRRSSRRRVGRWTAATLWRSCGPSTASRCCRAC